MTPAAGVALFVLTVNFTPKQAPPTHGTSFCLAPVGLCELPHCPEGDDMRLVRSKTQEETRNNGKDQSGHNVCDSARSKVNDTNSRSSEDQFSD